MNLLALAIAGACGTLARYGLGLLIQSWLARAGSSFPLGTLAINVLGSFVLAYVTSLALAGRVSPELRLAIGTGFCGAFTTFSTFELEAHGLISRGATLEAALYLAGNLALGFLAILAGRALAGA